MFINLTPEETIALRTFLDANREALKAHCEDLGGDADAEDLLEKLEED